MTKKKIDPATLPDDPNTAAGTELNAAGLPLVPGDPADPSDPLLLSAGDELSLDGQPSEISLPEGSEQLGEPADTGELAGDGQLPAEFFDAEPVPEEAPVDGGVDVPDGESPTGDILGEVPTDVLPPDEEPTGDGGPDAELPGSEELHAEAETAAEDGKAVPDGDIPHEGEALGESPAAEESPAPKRAARKKKVEEAPGESATSGAPAKKAAKAPAKPRAAARSVLTIENRAEVETQEDKEALVWHEMQNAARTKHILTGNLGGIERTENNNTIAVIYYKELRVVIPVSEMMIHLATEGVDYGDLAERQNKILNNMLGSDSDFVVMGLDAKTHSVVASRREILPSAGSGHRCAPYP